MFKKRNENKSRFQVLPRLCIQLKEVKLSRLKTVFVFFFFKKKEKNKQTKTELSSPGRANGICVSGILTQK